MIVLTLFSFFTQIMRKLSVIELNNYLVSKWGYILTSFQPQYCSRFNLYLKFFLA